MALLSSTHRRATNCKRKRPRFLLNIFFGGIILFGWATYAIFVLLVFRGDGAPATIFGSIPWWKNPFGTTAVLQQVRNSSELDLYLGDRQRVLDAEGASSYCNAQFTGWKLFDRWQAERMVWCRPLTGRHADGTTEPVSEFGCAALEIEEHGTRFVCDGQNLMIDFALTEGNEGGERLQDVMGQKEDAEQLWYQRGFLKMQCNLEVQIEDLVHIGLNKPALPWLESLRLDPRGGLVLKPRLFRGCNQWIEEPVIVVAREEYA
eukprot:CAMPEP_0118952824 /NCGR_PEP_ID=MMETSP1169-20130426/55523_1 /TAXON_ID=36882 /ORGANISM="Pyramimonas obovata, Strain CCMP722" /LENGTH=261 /DNA_ID=CAMNT_0006900159 /DNA_START=64 /DNA_END=846 /DNA_ORIENTATION=-